MESMTSVQILKEAVSVLLRVNALEKGIDLSVPNLAVGE